MPLIKATDSTNSEYEFIYMYFIFLNQKKSGEISIISYIIDFFLINAHTMYCVQVNIYIGKSIN